LHGATTDNAGDIGNHTGGGNHAEWRGLRAQRAGRHQRRACG